MRTQSSLVFVSFIFAFVSSISWAKASLVIHHDTCEQFVQCLSNHSTSISQVIYTPKNSSYTPILNLGIQNLRYTSADTPKPIVIVTPVHESQIQAVISCSKRQNVHMTIRGGGHDFEGLSYVSQVPFVIVDMINLRSVDVDVESHTAWVQGGATLGELYYGIAEKSKTLGFPAGVWSTVGVGGHLSGGGYGMMKRKHGLAADHVIDARLINVNGQILDRKSMGEDLFWAIRGGGASSFGVIVAWKVKLVVVPKKVTVFVGIRPFEENVTKLIHHWQYVAPTIDNDLYIRPLFRSRFKDVIYYCLFLGEANRLVTLMQENLPELGLRREDCTEMSWIDSAKVFSGFTIDQPPKILLNRSAMPKFYFKGKSDYVKEPILEKDLERLFKKFYNKGAPMTAVMELMPYGGRMSEIPEWKIPFPHRAGNLYMLYNGVFWDADTTKVNVSKHTNWLKIFHKHLGPYVSKSPRASYVNYIDLDLGVDSKNYAKASIWGTRYFKNNFRRLVQVKTKVDPDNFFNHPQSIPPFPGS